MTIHKARRIIENFRAMDSPIYGPRKNIALNEAN